MTITSSFHSVVDDRTCNHPYDSYSEPTHGWFANYPPLVYDLSLDFPLFLSELEFRSLYNHPEVSIPPSFPGRLNPPLDESTAHNPVLASSFTNEEAPYDIPSAQQPHLHQADEATQEALLFPLPSAPPHSPTPLAALHPQSLPEPTTVAFGALSALDQTQAQAGIHLPSTTFHAFGGGAATFLAPPVPLATTSPTPDPSSAVHICQCVTGGSLCNAVVSGSAQAVRNHLKQVHKFSSEKGPVVCPWAGCGKALQPESMRRHIISRHFRVKVRCVKCGAPLSRRDVQSSVSHRKACCARRQTASRVDSGV